MRRLLPPWVILSAVFEEKGGFLFGQVRHTRLFQPVRSLEMKKHIAPNLSSVEFEQKARETVSLLFALCEARVQESRANPSAELTTLASSALAVQKALETFLALLKICR